MQNIQFHKFIAVIDKGDRHDFYQRTIEIAKLSRMLYEAEPAFKEEEHNIQKEIYKRHQREQDEPTFIKAIDRAPTITPIIIDAVMRKFMQIENAGVLRNKIEILKNTTNTEKLQQLIDNYTNSSTQEVNMRKYIESTIATANVDGMCNGLMVITRTKGKDGKYTTAPLIIPPQDVLDIKGTKEEIEYAIIRTYKKVKNKIKNNEIEDAEVFNIYMPFYAVEAELITQKDITKDYEIVTYDINEDYNDIFDKYSPTKKVAIDNSVVTMANINTIYIQLPNGKYIKTTFYYHASNQTPCTSLGYINDNYTIVQNDADNNYKELKSTAYVPYWWKGIGDLFTILIDGKSLQASKDNFAYPIVYLYEVPCETCLKEPTSIGCPTCGGTGKHMPKSANEYIAIPLPHQDNMDSRMPLQEMIYQVPISLDNVNKLSEWITQNKSEFYKNIFGVDIFETSGNILTATEVRTQKESENQAIWRMSNKVAKEYKYTVICTALMNGLATEQKEIVVDFKYPEYLIPVMSDAIITTIAMAKQTLPAFVTTKIITNNIEAMYPEDEELKIFSNLIAKVDIYYPIPLTERKLVLENTLPKYMMIYALQCEAILKMLILSNKALLYAEPQKAFEEVINKCKEIATETEGEQINPALMQQDTTPIQDGNTGTP